MIVGPPAAGKSTFAVALADVIGSPVVQHVDQLRWEAPERRRPKGELADLVRAATSEPVWIAEGSVGPTVGLFAVAADVVLFLDYPRRVTLVRLLRRWVRRRRVGMPAGHRERARLDALRFGWTWRREHRSTLLADLAALKRVDVIRITSARVDPMAPIRQRIDSV